MARSARASRRIGSPRTPETLRPRIGLGIDRHPFDDGRRLVLGGVPIPGSAGLRGHSDADVLTHAVCDAMLGALGLPDLGLRFPASARRWRGRGSLFFLRDIVKEMRSLRYEVGNLDAVILAERPILGGQVGPMRRSLARALGCDPDRISLKPKRGEGLGFVGRGEGIEAHAAILLFPGAPQSRR